MKAGFGEADITPDVGSVLMGRLDHRKSTGVESKLSACAVVLETGGEAPTTVCLVVCDVFAISTETANEAREKSAPPSGACLKSTRRFACTHAMNVGGS